MALANGRAIPGREIVETLYMASLNKKRVKVKVTHSDVNDERKMSIDPPISEERKSL